jgi:hypothetical protein
MILAGDIGGTKTVLGLFDLRSRTAGAPSFRHLRQQRLSKLARDRSRVHAR